MKIVKKLCISCLAALILVLSVVPAVTASPAAPVSIAEDGATPRAEETEWFFRTTEDGKNQMRLWSITYSRWLTDWITIN